MSQEQKDKISKAHLGMIFSDEHRKNLSKSHKGHVPTNLEQLRELSKRPKSAECIKKIRLSNLGKKHRWTKKSLSKFRKKKLGKPTWNKGLIGFNAGPLNSRWISDRTKLKNRDRRHDSDYQSWFKKCRRRDNNRCRIGNKDCGGQLEVHHILSYKDYPELRYDIKNGITLCHRHHPRKKEEVERMITFLKSLI